MIGKNTERFQTEVTQLIQAHFPGIPEPKITCKQSAKRQYLSITATLYVHDQTALDLLYQALSKHPEMKMVL